jgi:2'-hydroxyisoflavone reductase
VIDVRDLAAWIVRAAETRLAGTFNAVAPPTTFADVFETCRRAAGSDATPVWVDPEFLVEQGVEEWMELPLWLHDPAFAAILETPWERGIAAGLKIRPLAETVAATLEWIAAGDAPPDPPAGLAREKERAVLEGWAAGRALR